MRDKLVWVMSVRDMSVRDVSVRDKSGYRQGSSIRSTELMNSLLKDLY